MDTPPPMIEPELMAPAPRRTRFTTGTQVARFLVWLLLISVVGMIWLLAWSDLDDLAALRAHGVSTTGHIMGKHSSIGNKSTTYIIEYGFMADLTLVTDDEDVPWSRYDRAREGDAIPVTYLPDHPQTHRTGRMDDARISRQRVRWTRGGLLTFLFLGAFVLAVEANYRSQRRLLREGVPVVGEVTDRSTVPGKSTTYYVTYRYQVSLGEWQTKKLSVGSRVYDQCPPGSALTVLYDRSRPSNSRPYRTITCAKLC